MLTKPNKCPVNLPIGHKIKTIRILKGYSQEELAEKIEVETRQIEECEKGLGNISVASLNDIAEALETDIITFLEPIRGKPVLGKSSLARALQSIDELEGIQDCDLQNSLYELIKTVSPKPQDPDL